MAIRITAVAVVAAILAVIGIRGGFDEVPAEGPPLVAVGTTVDTGPWRLTATNAAFAEELGPLRPRTEGGRIIAVSVIAELLADESRYPYEAVELSGVAVEDKLPTVRLVRDGELAGPLQPNVPERLAYVWELKPGTAAPASVTISLIGFTERADFLARRTYWHDRRVAARVQLPIEDRTVTG